MRIDLSGTTAVVTGSTKGIGLAAAAGLARAGARVVVNGRSRDAVDAALARLRDELPGAELAGHAGDLGDAAGCAALVRAEPRADILVNNLGIFGPEEFFETADATWERFFQVNVMSGVRLARAYLPAMAQRGWGRVVFVSSESALNVPVEMIHYGVTKTANLAIARGLAKRMAGTGVTVNAVLPGPTLSDGLEEMIRAAEPDAGRSVEEAAADFVVANRPTSLIRRAAGVEEVANMIVYAASPQASATTGAALRVDGGVVDSLV